MATISTLTANLELNSAQFRKELDKSQAKMRDARRRTRNLNTSVSKTGKAFRGAAQGVATMDGPLGGVASRITAVSGLLHSSAAAWTGFGAAVAGATFLLGRSVATFSEIESEQLKTQALLKATGFAAGRTARQLDDQARSIARATLASTQDIRQAQGVLLTFRTVQEESFDRAIKLSQDIAAIMGTKAKSAALQLGKALEDPATGLTALTRAGISFSQTEKQLIKDMVEAGQSAEAQRVILDKIEKQIGGAGVGAAGGLKGKVDSLSQSWEEFQETLAKTGAADIAAGSISGLSKVIDTLRQQIDPSQAERRVQLETEINELIRQRDLPANQGRARIIQQYQAQINLRQAELDAIDKVIDARDREERAEQQRAGAAAATAREQAEQERRRAALQAEQEAGAKSLESLKNTLAQGDEAVMRAHNQRLEIIKSLQLSEQQIREQGFQSIEQLRAEYAARSLQAADEQIAAQREREQAEIQRERERLQAEEQAAREQAENLISLQREKFDRIHQEALRAQGRTEELEQLRFQAEMAELQEEMERLRERNLATQTIEDEFRQAKEEAERVHQAKLSEIHAKAEQERLDNQLRLFDIATNAALTADERQLAAAIQIGKAIFDAKKRQKTKEALIAGKLAIQEAWASAPFPLNIPAVALTTAETAANVAAIQGVAHAGLDNVPREGTYLLQRGEAVLQPRANAALMDFLDREGRGGGVKVIVNNNAPVEVTARDAGQDENGVRQVEIVVESMRRAIYDGQLDEPLQNTYGLSRSRGSLG